MSDAERPAFNAGWSVDDEESTAALAAEVRALVSALRRADAPTDDLVRAAALVRDATALLGPHRVAGMAMQGRIGDDGPAGTGPIEPARFFPWSPIIGPLNPLSASMHLDFDAATSTMTGTATFDTQYVGPPGMVHGGIIALAFDELLGTTNVCLGLGGFTGTLSVRYERPTPIETELTMEARVERTEGRKVITVGTISHAGEVTARAEGIFIRTVMWEQDR